MINSNSLWPWYSWSQKNQYSEEKECQCAYFPYENSPAILLASLFLSFKCQLRNSSHFYLHFKLTVRKCQTEEKYLLAPKNLLWLYSIFLYVLF